jgi:hypothetical protein
MSTCNYTQPIFETECIGDSLPKINANFSNLDTGLCSIVTSSNTQIPSLTSLKQQVESSVLFVPAQFTSRSNSNIVLAGHQYAGQGNSYGNILPATNTNSLALTGTNKRAWWSGAKTITITNAPAKTIAVLIEVWYNVNSAANNTQRLFIRKDSTETGTGWPTSGEGDITDTQRNNFSSSFGKMYIDPIGNSSSVPEHRTFYEGENITTFIVYVANTANPTTKQFQYCIVDYKDLTPYSTPDYTVYINLQGYYVEVN